MTYRTSAMEQSSCSRGLIPINRRRKIRARDSDFFSRLLPKPFLTLHPGLPTPSRREEPPERSSFPETPSNSIMSLSKD
ncbi:hypothetical protein CDAR_126971 [Caerostris darwini]|uniref:Uncharacterized protein n=1 Tax=Caerostris darwini TaxID=1538125 RepID=A0AAV4S021_9ARAC|nr:hypothetical protein CDAR_126971 [Caerostris darwini]